MLEVKSNEIVVIASNSQEMVESQNALVANVAVKIESAKAEVEECQSILSATISAKVNQTAAKRLLKHAEHRVLYLEKVHAALAAGYVMVPDLPRQVLAIRIQRGHPEQGDRISTYSQPRVLGEVPDALPAGQGEYVHPVPDATEIVNRHPDGKIASMELSVGEFQDEFSLPISFLKPTIIARTGEAVELKVFDEIVAVYDGAKEYQSRNTKKISKGDPMVIGRIFDVGNGRQKSQRRRTISFLIAWFVDTATI